MTRAWKITTAILFTLILGLLPSSCGDDDCPVCPPGEPVVKPYKGWLYYAETSSSVPYDVYVIDMETDSIVDSIDLPGYASGGIDVSSDGRYLAVSGAEIESVGVRCYLYDAQTREFIRELPDRIVPHFDVVNGYLLGIYFNGEKLVFRLLRYPSFEPVYDDDTLAYGWRRLDTKHHLVYGTGPREKRYNMFAYDYVQRVLSEVPITDTYGDTVQVFDFCLNRAGTRLYFVALSKYDPFSASLVGAYDLVANQTLWLRNVVGKDGGVALSADETELYTNDPGIPGMTFDWGVVMVLDAATGVTLHTYSMYGIDPNPFQSVAVDEYAFSPAGDKLYMAGGATVDRDNSTVIVVDVRKREIIKFMTPDFHRAIAKMVIGPKLDP